MRMERKRATLKVREEALRGVLQTARDRLAALAGSRESGRPPGGTTAGDGKGSGAPPTEETGKGGEES